MGDDVLFRRSVNGVLLKCINKEDALKVIGEVHEGTCGAHQSGYNMKWTINRYDNYWPTIIKIIFCMPEDVRNIKSMAIYKESLLMS